jgi:hypothetical protein
MKKGFIPFTIPGGMTYLKCQNGFLYGWTRKGPGFCVGWYDGRTKIIDSSEATIKLGLNPKVKRNPDRDFSLLHECLPSATKVQIKSKRGVSHATFTGNSFVTDDGITFDMPYHFSKYHNMIHGGGSAPTGWNVIIVKEGPYKDLSIGHVYNMHYNRLF